jgi:glycosyltransferase involved in cell wall biosynthesis
VPELMRNSDVLLLPSIEEGFGLTCVEAMGSGCVPLVSDACTDVCVHGENALVHPVGDVDAIAEHITMVDRDRRLLSDLRLSCLRSAPQHTWTQAGRRLLDVYASVV